MAVAPRWERLDVRPLVFYSEMKHEWAIELHDEVFAWLSEQKEEVQERVRHGLVLLASQGPSLGRPLVDTVTGSSFANMKELRVGSVRILFAFDPRRRAVLLVAGDKRGAWRTWYQAAIPVADARLIEWLNAEEEPTWDS